MSRQVLHWTPTVQQLRQEGLPQAVTLVVNEGVHDQCYGLGQAFSPQEVTFMAAAGRGTNSRCYWKYLQRNCHGPAVEKSPAGPDWII